MSLSQQHGCLASRGEKPCQHELCTFDMPTSELQRQKAHSMAVCVSRKGKACENRHMQPNATEKACCLQEAPPVWKGRVKSVEGGNAREPAAGRER